MRDSKMCLYVPGQGPKLFTAEELMETHRDLSFTNSLPLKTLLQSILQTIIVNTFEDHINSGPAQHLKIF